MAIQFNHLPVVPLRITSRFGKRNTGIVGASTDHKGIDLGGDKSKPQTPVLTVRAGTVLQNYWNDVRGWVIVIRHDGFDTLYQHLKAQSPLAVGSKIKARQTIGIMGTTGSSTGIHLHFEVQVDGTPIDPEPYLLNIIPEEEDMVRYKTLTDIPTWGKSTVEKLIRKGWLQGDHNGDINLSEDLLRSFVINDRAGLYGE